MHEKRPPFHLGAPLGFGALTALAGVTGFFLLTDDKPRPSVTTETAQKISAIPSSMEKDNTLATHTGGLEIESVTQAKPEQVIPVSAPEKASPPAPSPPEAVPPAPKLPTSIPAQAVGAEVTFIVRIKGNEAIDRATKLYRKDKAAALDLYQSYLDGTPELADFQISGASYSGEIKLTHRLPPGQPADRSTISKLKSKIMSVEGVSYADPDYVAHPGKE